MQTKEEIITSHPFLRVWIENTDDSPIRCMNEDHALWAMDEYAAQCVQEKCTLPVVSNSYCGEEGEQNMKAELKEIMHACGDEFDFLRLINEAKEELREEGFDRDQESRMNGV